uniref:CBP80/20-dependent translation initiation factor-like n=1 Tax=Styela clava TaxID=7725 RepID=UPI001939FE4E|nr:CBP80/20-dependent translation initiation factor-like [Styela clava]
MEDDILSSEIADLESFIDSYVGDVNVDPIPSEVFTNTNAKHEDLKDLSGLKRTTSQQSEEYSDFQEELLHHQNKPENLRNGNLDEQFAIFENLDLHGNAIPSYYNSNNQNWNQHHSGNGFPDFRQNFQGYHGPTHRDLQQHSGLPGPTFPSLMSLTPNYYTHMSNNYNPQQNRRDQHPLSPKSPQGNYKSPKSGNMKYTPPKRQNSDNSISDTGSFDGSYKSNESKNKDKHKGRRDKLGSDSDDWRRPYESLQNGSKNTHPMKAQSNKEKSKVERTQSDKGSRTNEPRRKYTPPKNTGDKPFHSRQSSNCSSNDGGNVSHSKSVSGRSKAEVRSWLKSDRDPIEKKIKNLEISQSKDLPKLINTAQKYITSERKMREVAEMVCNKAMRNPLFTENGAKLCDEMSRHMINGMNFRTIVLNIVQGHFKNRHCLMMTSIKNPRDHIWIGFTTFLIALYLNLRTSSNERIKALINPIFDCLFQMLNENNVTPAIIRCFRVSLQKIGAILAEKNSKKMSELICILRDKCVLPNKLSIEARRDLLHALEIYARGWKPHALDNEVFYNEDMQ